MSGGPQRHQLVRGGPSWRFCGRASSVAVAVLIIALAAPAFAQESEVGRGYRVVLAAAVIAHGMDLSSTAWCRGADSCHEANPALRWAEDDALKLGAAKMALASASMLAIDWLRRKGHGRLAFWGHLVAAGITAAVAVRNMRMVAR